MIVCLTHTVQTVGEDSFNLRPRVRLPPRRRLVIGAELAHVFRMAVRATYPVPVREEMPIVVAEQLVVHVVVRRRAHAYQLKQPVPRMMGLGMDQTEPVRVERPEGHVAPDVAVDDGFRREER